MLKKIMNKRIQKRLFSSSIMSSTIMMIASIISIIAMIYMAGQYGHVLNYYAFPQGDIGHAMAALADVRSCTRGAIGYEDGAVIDKMVQEHDKHTETLTHYIQEISGSIVTDEGREKYNAMTEALYAYYAIDQKVLELGAKEEEQYWREAQRMAVEDMAPAYEAAYTALEGLMTTNISLGDSTQSKLNTIVNILIFAIIAIVIASGLMATKLSQIITKSITGPIYLLVERMKTFADGDIDSPFPEHDVDDEVAEMLVAVSATTTKLRKIFADLEQLLGNMADGNFNITTSCEEEYVGGYNELLQAIRRMNRQMDGTLKEVREAANTVSNGSSNLADASQALAEGASEQAASVQEMQATIDEITTALERTVGEVNASFEKAEACATEAEKSRHEMEAMMEAMNRISDTSQKIGNIIAELEDIASQTNLLSLNASIEAARAGEAGRGFAVVADQIRNLAEQSAKSAVNSKELIEESIREVEQGNKVAVKTSDVLVTVVNSIHEIAETSKMISELSGQQAEAMEQANHGIGRISEVVEANSATAEEASATSEELSAQAISMEGLVNRFKLRE